MEYLVHTSGEVAQFHNKAYVVKASSEQEAQEIAKKNFGKEFNCVKINAEAQSYTRTRRSIAACILMLIAIVIACFPFDPGWWSKPKTFLRPDMYSCVWAIVFYCVYVIRFKGIQRTVETPIDIIMCLFVVVLLSTFFKMLLHGPEVFGIEIFSPNKFLIIACFASLLGIKIVSVGCFLLVVCISLKYSLQGTTQGRYLTGGVPPVRFSM